MASHVHQGEPTPTPPLAIAQLDSIATSQPSYRATNILIIDSAVTEGDRLLSGVNLDKYDVYWLKSDTDGVEQIANILGDRTGITSLHILSHGSPGSVQLGNAHLSNDNLDTYASQLQQWKSALTEDADILLYGCNVAAETQPTDANFIQRLSFLTRADVAASNNLTGSAAFGFDWELEVRSGNIEAKQPIDTAIAAAYDRVLAAPVATADNPHTSADTKIIVDVLANDTGGTGRLKVLSVTTPTNGTAIINDWIYVGGLISNINGIERSGLARFNADGSLDTSFDAKLNDAAYAIAIAPDGKPVIGGDFTTVSGISRNRIARLNEDGSLDTSFNPGTGLNDNILAIEIGSDGKPVTGGMFTTVNGTSRNRIARFNADGSLDTSFDPGTGMNNEVFDIAIGSDGKPVVTGSFTTVNSASANYIARLNSDGSLDPSFNAGLDKEVGAIAIDSNGKFVIAGDFTTVNGTTRNRIARLNADSSLDPSFNPGTGIDNFIQEIAIASDGKLVAGGGFINVNGTPRKDIARLNADGSLDPSFDPGAGTDGFLRSLAIGTDGQLVIGGEFNSYNGTNIPNGAMLNADGSLDTSSSDLGTGLDGPVFAIVNDPRRNIFYTPNAGFNGVDTFNYTTTDGSSTSTATVTVLVNNSPVLDNSASSSLTNIAANDINNSGTLISTIIASTAGITDPNTGALQGIAITGLDTTNGSWQFTTDGSTWNNFTASPTSALLLASDATTRIRFVPNAGYSGAVTNAITFTAWDKITGTNGGTADVTADKTSNVDSSPFSSVFETASIIVAPTVLSINRVNPDPNNQTSLNYTLTFTEDVTGVDTTDFTLAASGVTGAAIASVTPVNANTYTVTVNTGSGDGTLGLNLADNDSITSTATSLPLGTTGVNNADFTGQVYTIDKTAPTSDIIDVTPDLRNSSVSTIAITFSEAIAGFDLADLSLTLNGGSNLLTGSETLTTSDNINWTLGNLTGLTGSDGNYQLTLAVSNITDNAGNPLATNVSDTWQADLTPPGVTINQDPGQADPTAASPINFTVVFSEPVTGFATGDVTLNGSAGATTAVVTGSGTTYNVAVSGMTGNGTAIASILAGVATDAAGNANIISTSIDNTVNYDTTFPTVSTINRVNPDPNNLSSVNYTVTFSENVTGVDVSDFTLAPTGITGAAIASVTGSGNTYNVQVNTGSGDGTLQLNLSDDDSIKNALNVPLGGTGLGNGKSTGQIYQIDKTPPTAIASLSNITAAGGTAYNFTVTYSDNTAINVSSLDNTDIRVTGAGGFNQLASLVSFTPAANGTPSTAIYSFTPPGGTWDKPDNGSYTVTVESTQVSDTSTNTITAAELGNFTVNLNAAPTAVNDSATTLKDTAVTINVLGNDGDSDGTLNNASVAIASSPTSGSTSIDITTGAIAYTPNSNFVGTDSFTYTVKDNNGDVSNSATVTVQVANTNNPPILGKAIADNTVPADQSFTFVLPPNTFTDPDNNPLTYTATLDNGNPLPSWLTFDATSRTFSGTPALNNLGSINIKVFASDGSASVSDIFQLTVSNAPNNPPVVNAIADNTVTADQSFTFVIPPNTFTDPDNNPLTYTATLENGDSLPSWLTFDATSRTFSGTPALNNLGSINIKVFASDGSASVSDIFQLTVSNAPNNPPGVESPNSSPPSNASNLLLPPDTFRGTEIFECNCSVCDSPTEAIAVPLNANPNTVDKALYGGISDDLVIGTQDNEAILGYNGNDLLQGSHGNDTIFGGNGTNGSIGNAGDRDLLFGNTGADYLLGNEGEDIIYSGKDNDLAWGGKDNDFICGDNGGDTVYGDNGDDTICGGNGSNQSIGSEGEKDWIAGGLGNDVLYGNEGDDTVKGDRGNDSIYGGKDEDVLCGGEDSDQIFGNVGKDNICGGDGNDFLNGNQENDCICGDEGDDTLHGGKDNDTLIGGNGIDVLSGDLGDDILTGGGGSDKFILTGGNGSDIIADFKEGEDFLELYGGLTFTGLTISQGENAAKISVGDEVIASLIGVQAINIGVEDFALR